MLNRLDDVVRGFAEACARGDIAALRATMAADVVAVCDTGGLVPSATGSAHGAADAALLAAVVLGGRPDTELTVESVNGHAGLVLRQGGRAIAVVSIQTAAALVVGLWIVLNPAKLHHWHRR